MIFENSATTSWWQNMELRYNFISQVFDELHCQNSKYNLIIPQKYFRAMVALLDFCDLGLDP